jgi:hypothetical protein
MLQPQPGSTYYFRRLPRNQTAVHQVVPNLQTTPTGGVTLHGGLLGNAFERNQRYLSGYNVDDMLYWFRRRNGTTNPPGQSWGWDYGGPDMPYGLKGRCGGQQSACSESGEALLRSFS